MAQRDTPPRRVLRRLPAPARQDARSGAKTGPENNILKKAAGRWISAAKRLLGRLFFWPFKALAASIRRLGGASAWLAPYNPRARRRFRQAVAAMVGIADDLHADYAVAHTVNVALVYRLETAHAALTQALAATRRHQAGPPPDDDRSRLATALLQVVYLAQVAREWQQDSINLRHALNEYEMSDAQRIRLDAGVRQLDGYVAQNIADSARWLEAARRLYGKGGKRRPR